MKTTLIVTALGVLVLTSTAARAAEFTGMFSQDVTAPESRIAIAGSDEIAAGARYLVPELPADVIEQLPAAEIEGDRYLTERVELADLVVDDRILAAEDRANEYARDLPGFADVLRADGFRQDVDGVWFYDLYTSWLRFPLNR